MKTLFARGTFMAIAVTALVAGSYQAWGDDQPASPPTAEDALPPNIPPGSPTAEVIQLVRAGVTLGVIQSYISNSAAPFNLDAEAVIALNDAGVPTSLINDMIARDKVLGTPVPTAEPQPAAPPVAVASAEPATVAAPPTEVTVNYFYGNLAPYGSWVEVAGYGRCWRPTVLVYDSTWQPYCDRGHWVYTDCGWYWDSDYSWGVTFHYGRWFRDSRFGWCWWPDTVWGPSWVTWRAADDYCGWAPLPPFSVYRPGLGFFYRGANVAVGFSFGLGADCYTFVPSSRFLDRRPRYYCAPPRQVNVIYERTTVINNYHERDRTVINRGIEVDRIRTRDHRSIEPVAVAQLPNAARQGWRGHDAGQRPGPSSPGDRGNSRRDSGSDNNNQFRHGPATRPDQGNASPPSRNAPSGVTPPGQPDRGSSPQSPNYQIDRTPTRSTPPDVRPGGSGAGQRGNANRNAVPPNAGPNRTAPANNNPTPGTPVDRNPQRNNGPANNPTRYAPAATAAPVVRSQPLSAQPTMSAPRVPDNAPRHSPSQPNTPPPSVQSSVNRPVMSQSVTPPVSRPANPPAMSAPRLPENYQRNYPPSTPPAATPPPIARPASPPALSSPRNSENSRSEAAPRSAPAAQPAPSQSQSHGSDKDRDRQNR